MKVPLSLSNGAKEPPLAVERVAREALLAGSADYKSELMDNLLSNVSGINIPRGLDLSGRLGRRIIVIKDNDAIKVRENLNMDGIPYTAFRQIYPAPVTVMFVHHAMPYRL